MLFHWINLIILIGVLVIFSRKKLSLYFKAKRKELEDSMHEAEKDSNNIQREYSEIKEKLDHLEPHMHQIKDEAGYMLDREIRKIKEETKSFVEKMKRDTESKMNQGFDQAQRKIEKELVEIAIATARTKLESRMNSKDSEWTDDMIQSASTEFSGKSNYAS